MLKCTFVNVRDTAALLMLGQYHQELGRGMSNITADSQTSYFDGMLGKCNDHPFWPEKGNNPAMSRNASGRRRL